MNHPLASQLQAVERRVARLLWLHGIARVVTLVGAVVLLLGGADYAFRFRDPGLRLLCFAALAGVLVWAVRRYLVRQWRRPRSSVGLAQRLESHFPELASQLASAIDFLGQAPDDPYGGSPQLRSAVVERVAQRAAAVDFKQAVNSRPARRASIWAALVLGIGLGAVLADPQSTRLALVRLIKPWGAAQWPRQNELIVRDPVRAVPQGGALEVEVADARGRALPSEVWLVLRYQRADGSTEIERLRMQFAGERATVRKEAVTEPLAYRAVGGDDDRMKWIGVEVVEPPVLSELSVELHLPAYTGWPSEPAPKDFTALVGSRVELRGRASKPLRQARLVRDGRPNLELALDDDRRGFALTSQADAPWVVEKTESYSIELEDEVGLVGGREMRYQARAVTDLAPSVTVDDPPGNVFLTPQAELPLVLTVRDDLAIQQVELRWTKSSGGSEESLRLFTQDLPPPPASPDGRGLAERLAAAAVSLPIEHRWAISTLSLAPGDQLSFRVVAADFQPREGQCPPRRVTVVSPEDLQNRLAERQGFLLSELGRLLQLERDARAQLAAVSQQASAVGELRKQDVDQLHGAELTQRQVARGLTGEGEGLLAQIADIQNELRNNQVDSPDFARQMERVGQTLGELEQNQLPRAEQALVQAVKAAKIQLGDPSATTASSAELRKPLAEAEASQDETIAQLESLVAELGQWDNYRRFQRELAQLRTRQQELTEQTRELGRETLARDRGALSPQQQADLQKLGRAQGELSRQLARVQERMAASRDELEGTDPLAAATLDDAVEQGQQSAAASRLRQAAGQVEQNQLGQALENQAQAESALEEMIDILANRREHELARLVEKLREAEAQLGDQQAREEGLRRQFDQAAAESDPTTRREDLSRLAEEQAQLQEEAERLARRLERLQAEAAARSQADAGQRMSQAGQAGNQDQAGEAAEQARQAEQDLAEAAQQLAERRRQAEQDLATQQLARWEDQLRGMEARQTELVAETGRLKELETGGSLTPGQWGSVAQLSRQQASLADESEALGQQLTQAEVFALVLEGAGRDMRRAADQLAHQRLGGETLAAAESAQRRLRQLLQALASDDAEPEEEEANPGGDQSGGGEQQGADAGLAVAQVRMIKLWQVELNERTARLAEQLAGQPRPSPAAAAEYAALSAEQGQLADLIRNLIPPAAEQDAADPEAPPPLEALDEPADSATDGADSGPEPATGEPSPEVPDSQPTEPEQTGAEP